jgi:hypothetical protein
MRVFISFEQESTDDNVLMFQGAITIFTEGLVKMSRLWKGAEHHE